MRRPDRFYTSAAKTEVPRSPDSHGISPRAATGRRNFLKTTLAAAATTTLALPRQSHAQSGTLVVTSYGGPWEQFMRDTIVPAYEKEHPGSKVELAIGLSKDWVAKMKAAGKA